jgi:hypothetical protein
MPKLTPFYAGFTSEIKQTPNKDRFYTSGRVSLLEGKSLEIEDLPVNIWIEKFKKKFKIYHLSRYGK